MVTRTVFSEELAELIAKRTSDEVLVAVAVVEVLAKKREDKNLGMIVVTELLLRFQRRKMAAEGDWKLTELYWLMELLSIYLRTKKIDKRL
jgi:hypothetical protein